MEMNQPPAKRLIGLMQAVGLCERLDAAERDAGKARAALVIARFSINRVRIASLLASRRTPI